MLCAGPAWQRLRRELHSPLRGSPVAQGLQPYGRGKWLCPLPLPADGGPPPHPQHVCAAARPPCLLQTHTSVLGPLGCADAHLEMQGGRARRTPVLLDGLAPPGRGRVPPSVLTDGLPPPARRVPPMHLAAHSKTVVYSRMPM